MVTDIPIKIQIVKSLNDLKPSRMVAVKADGESSFSLYVTDKNGVPYPLKDLQGSGGITTVTNTDGNLVITGIENKVINISPTLLTLINSALQPSDLGNINNIEKISAESIPSHTPVAIYNNQAYKLDNLNPLHQFSFAGFSTNGTSIGESCIIQQEGEISLLAWGLTPDAQYLASTNGVIQLNNISAGFTKVIGYAINSDTLRIIKEYTTINK